MSEIYFCATADDIALDDYSTPDHLQKLLEFWDEQGLKGTLFVVPRSNGIELTKRKEYVELLKCALGNGHEIAQHGLDHGRFQTGIPPQMVLDLPHEGPAREYLRKNRKKIIQSLSVENIRKDLATGRDIVESAVQQPLRGFRAPCLSTCDNLFKALDMEGYIYDSSSVLQETAWQLINNPDAKVTPRPINRQRFQDCQMRFNFIVLPISAEYTWYLTERNYTVFLDLAKHDYDCCATAGIPFVPVCHISPVMQGDVDCGLNLYRELIAYAKQQALKHKSEFISETLYNVSMKLYDE